MEKITKWLEKYLMPIAAKLSANRYLSAISNGFTALLPVIMVGAIFTLLANLQIDVYQNAIAAVGLDTIFAYPATVTTNLLAVYASFTIANALAKNLGMADHAISCGTISLLAFLILIPQGVSGTTDAGEVVEVSSAISTSYLGSAGLFSAIICGLLVPTIYKFFIDRNITIKMPDQVPPTISKAFAGMIPAFAITIIFCLVRYGFSFTSYGDFNTFLYTVIQTPLLGLAANPLSFVIVLLMCQIMWFFGIHGGMVVSSVRNMIFLPLSLENLEALSAGEEMVNLVTDSMWFTTAQIGGAGGTLSLCIYLAFFAKSSRYKSLGRMALPSSLCGINEPLTFGIPIVMNPMLLIPYVVTPIVTFLIAYACEYFGIIPLYNGTVIPTGTPVILSAFLANGWQAAVLQVILIAVGFLIYYPFIKVLDDRAYAEEQGEAPAEEAVANA